MSSLPARLQSLQPLTMESRSVSAYSPPVTWPKCTAECLVGVYGETKKGCPLDYGASPKFQIILKGFSLLKAGKLSYNFKRFRDPQPGPFQLEHVTPARQAFDWDSDFRKGCTRDF